MTTKLSKRERTLSALQRDAIARCAEVGGAPLDNCDARTRASLLRRKLVDQMGTSDHFVATDLGRSVLAYREAHTGRAQR